MPTYRERTSKRSLLSGPILRNPDENPSRATSPSPQGRLGRTTTAAQARERLRAALTAGPPRGRGQRAGASPSGAPGPDGASGRGSRDVRPGWVGPSERIPLAFPPSPLPCAPAPPCPRRERRRPPPQGVNGEDVRLMLWDTAGQEEFDAITKAYYRGAQACVLVFSTTDRESFKAIPTWKQKVVAEVGDIPTVLVQNKIDLLDDSCIKNEEAEALAKKLKVRFYRASVKEDLNVSEVFKYLADKYLQKLKQQTAEDSEVVHTSSNKIGVFNTAGGSHSNQNSSTLNGGDVINLKPNKQRTKKNRSPFSNCSIP
ncbi:ras-related protein Rab-23 isoform X1 [Motacilla alba alba]|uniref:ras-related protein Rab-23 isoform X1 n=1 Tax=Motacilla alba alba TaxID=1094192 RepID=UPI0018D58B5D|nr:ras-related protein Rab-23 isoform X1 [Motacilla alba alba]